MPKKPPRNDGGDDPPREGEAAAAIKYFTDKLGVLLTDEAHRLAAGKEVTETDVERAYEGLIDPSRRHDIQNTISTALRENKFYEVTTYVMIFGLFALGSFLLVTGLTQTQDLTTRVTGIVGGSVAQLLVLPAVRWAIAVRRHNLSIRMLGALVERNDPALVPTLKELLKSVLSGRA
jgi:hypothetical protein